MVRWESWEKTLMLSCKNVCHIASESQDRTLSVRERFAVTLHLLMCRACQRVVAQIELLRTVARRLRSAENAEPGLEHGILSTKARARIRGQLRDAGTYPHNHK